MAFNIRDFKAALKDGGARSDLFEVLLNPPNGSISQQLRFLCKAASLPAATNTTVSAKYFGRAVKFAGNREFADWKITIINDEDFLIRGVLEAWANRLNRNEANYNDFGSSPRDYKVDAQVFQYGKDGVEAPLRQYKFVGVFPTSVDEIPLSWDDEKIEEYSVTLSVDYWLPEEQ